MLSSLHGADPLELLLPLPYLTVVYLFTPPLPPLPGYSLYGMVANQLGDVDSLMELPPGSVRLGDLG